MACFLTISPGRAVTTSSYTPAWNLSSAGTAPLSFYPSAGLCRSHRKMAFSPRSAMPDPTQGISRNFSALRLHNRSHPFVFTNRGQLHTVSFFPRCRVVPPAAGALFPCVSFQRGVGHTHGRTGRTRTGTARGVPVLHHLLPPECAITLLFHIARYRRARLSLVFT